VNVLVINAGSSSLKYQLMNVETQEILAIGICEKVGSEDSFHKYGLDGAEQLDETPMKDHDDAMALVIEALVSGPTKALDSLAEIDAVGHRVVQGGQYYPISTLIDDEAISKISELSVLAPLHNPPALMDINACKNHMPHVPMVAVFDTSFFQTLEPSAYMYPLPYELFEKHGILFRINHDAQSFKPFEYLRAHHGRIFANTCGKHNPVGATHSSQVNAYIILDRFRIHVDSK
jgi:acetate kinase